MLSAGTPEEELPELLEEEVEELLELDALDEEDELEEELEPSPPSVPPQAAKPSAKTHVLAKVIGRRQSINFIWDIVTYLFI